jgi:hypothetical protein
MIYYLPLEIKGRGFHIAALQEHQPQIASPIKQYVLENRSSVTNLFNLDSDTRLIAAQGGFSQDLYWSTVTLDFDATLKQLTLNVTTVSGTEPPLPTRPNVVTNKAPTVVHTTFDKAKGHLKIALKANQFGSFEVVLQADVLGTKVASKFKLHVAPAIKIWDVALDFGSEASQLSKRSANGGTRQAIPLIDGFKLFYKDKNAEPNTDFIQYDKAGFFRSIFFIPNNEDALLSTIDPPHTQNELIPMLNDSKKGGHQFDTQLPTIKLAALGIDNTKTVQVNGGSYTLGDLSKKIYRKLIFNFLHVACNSIKSERTFYLRFKLLIPNVFKQVDITNLVQSVEKYAEEFKNRFTDYQLKGIEISTVSESDAAFAGYMLTPNLNLQINGKYAIIDAGRGTTDYSVVEILRPHEGVNLYRAGFVGAGAMLTFAFIDTVITTILVEHLGKTLTPAQRLAFFEEKICGVSVELNWQLKFLSLIERLKARYEQGMENPDSEPLILKQPNILNTPLNILNNLLEDFVDKKVEYFIQDKFGFIKATTDALANRIFADFQKLPVEFSRLNGIILSGRGFLFEPLRDALKQKFEKITTNIVLSAEPKNVCMDGAFTSSSFNGNCNMEGIPYAATLLTNRPQQLAPPPPPVAQHRALALLDRIRAIINAPDSDAVPAQTRKKYYQDIHKFLKGGSRQLVNQGDIICISGHVYEHDLRLQKSEVNLFFTGEGFLIRTANRVETLRDINRQDINDAFTAKTLFPTLTGKTLPLGII